ncbi:pro-resilin-like [Penaeus monodon]|uniref:pro-resilin-like n=1 Tax=Penaeus monodon TaxID=6687 RepID=UPI0018A759A4|nr:pro-resilin-like [Penaeus monodon]
MIAKLLPHNPSLVMPQSTAYEEPAKYDFNYAVKDKYPGNDFGHQEARDGYDTQGSYYVAYTVSGDSGYVAEVSYEGEDQYAEYKPAPSYKPVSSYKPTPASA